MGIFSVLYHTLFGTNLIIEIFVKAKNMIKMMQSNFVMFMILGLLICFPSSLDAVECRCSPRTTDNQFGQVLGACETRAPWGPHQGKFFCYVSNSDPRCCQDSCVNFDLCDCSKVDCTVSSSYYGYVAYYN